MNKEIIKGLLKRLGFEIRRYSISQNHSARLMKLLADQGVNLVLDIGANMGQFGLELRKIGYKGNIVSFEPLLEPYNILCNTLQKDNFWQAASRSAIGEEDGEIEINIAGNSASSSILAMLESHFSVAPTSKSVGVEVVPLKKLDSLSSGFIKEDSVLFVKIDTQGYEDKVLNGGIDTLKRTNVLQVELSLIELYSGQKLFVEMIQKINDIGFELWAIEPVFTDSTNGRILQVDALFCRNGKG